MSDSVIGRCFLVHKKISFFALITVVMMCGCTLGGGYKTKINKEEQETEYSTVYAEIIEFSGIKNKKYQSELNMSVENDVSAAISEFDAVAHEAQPNMPPGVKSVLHITQTVTRNSNCIISFIEEHYIYLGGAHGTTAWFPRTVDTTADEFHIITLDELFCDDKYMEKLNSIISEMVTKNPDKYSEMWAEPKITEENKNRFYLTDTDLVIFFPPYELSYYAKGFIEFPIPLESINPILNERYREK